ncbi:hypothetical protein [Providencia sp. Je.9.19]
MNYSDEMTKRMLVLGILTTIADKNYADRRHRQIQGTQKEKYYTRN